MISRGPPGTVVLGYRYETCGYWRCRMVDKSPEKNNRDDLTSFHALEIKYRSKDGQFGSYRPRFFHQRSHYFSTLSIG
jgi:hypothetical protein